MPDVGRLRLGRLRIWSIGEAIQLKAELIRAGSHPEVAASIQPVTGRCRSASVADDDRSVRFASMKALSLDMSAPPTPISLGSKRPDEARPIGRLFDRRPAHDAAEGRFRGVDPSCIPSL